MARKDDPHQAIRFIVIVMFIAGIVVMLAYVWDVLDAGDFGVAIFIGFLVSLVLQAIQVDLAHQRRAWRQDEE